MRDLETNELSYVAGGSSPRPPSAGCGCSPSAPSRGPQGNNGFGNGSDAPNLAAPGGSGDTPGDKDFSQDR